MEAADSTFWFQLGQSFRSTDPQGSLSARFHHVIRKPPRPPAWSISDANTQAALMFEKFARLGGFALDPAPGKDSLQTWLKELMEASCCYKYSRYEIGGPEALDDGTFATHAFGGVESVCSASATLCLKLGNEALVIEQRSATEYPGEVVNGNRLPRHGVDEVSEKSKLPGTSGRRPHWKTRPKNQVLCALRAEVLKMKAANFSHLEMCKRLGATPRPPGAAWASETKDWETAYRSTRYGPAVKKWLSHASKVRVDKS